MFKRKPISTRPKKYYIFKAGFLMKHLIYPVFSMTHVKNKALTIRSGNLALHVNVIS
jgi:hypothetical protein